MRSKVKCWMPKVDKKLINKSLFLHNRDSIDLNNLHTYHTESKLKTAKIKSYKKKTKDEKSKTNYMIDK